MRDDAGIRRTERWLVHQGVPQLIADYRFRSHVLPRMLPFLAALIVITVTATLVVGGAGHTAFVLAVALVLLVAFVSVPRLLARLGHRRPSPAGDGTRTVLVAFAATPVLVPLVLLGAYSRDDWARTAARLGGSTAQVAVATGLALAAVFAAAFVVSWLATAYGLVPLAVRAVSHAVSDMRGSLQLQGRALPTLLFVTFFLFFTGELWQLMNHLAWGRLVLVLALFAAVTVLATSARLRSEINRVEQDLSEQRLAAACVGTPLAGFAPPSSAPAPPPALTARQETNVLLVLVTRQLIQAVVVGLGLFAFFVVLGLIVVDHTIATAWIGAEPQRSAWIPVIPVALFRAAVLLAGFGSMYFAITTMTQEEYRREFFEPVIADVERTLAVRAVYLNLRSAPPTVAD